MLDVILLDGMSLVHVHERWTASRGLEITTTALLSFDAALDPRSCPIGSMSARGRACIEVPPDPSQGERLLAVVAHRPWRCGVPVVDDRRGKFMHEGRQGSSRNTHAHLIKPPVVVTKVKGTNHWSAMLFWLGGGSSSIFAM